MHPILLIMWTAFQSFILRHNNNNNNNNNNNSNSYNNNNNNNNKLINSYKKENRWRTFSATHLFFKIT